MKKTKHPKAKQGKAPALVQSSSLFPEPHDLLKEAEKETGQTELKSYARVIATLRRKGFSFREIAEWLNARGVPTNHNAVYRTFTNCLDGGEIEEIEEGLHDG
jgi:hypothetical protein